METRKRKPRSDIGQPTPGRGNRSAKGVNGHNGKNAGRKKGRTLLLGVFALPEETADFIRYEQARRGDDDPRETIKAMLAEQALTWQARRHAALDPTQYIM